MQEVVFRDVYLARSRVCSLLNAVPAVLTLAQRQKLLEAEAILRAVEEEAEQAASA